MAKTKQATSWDDASNEANNNFVAWSKIGDYVYGTLTAIKEVKSTLPGKEGEKQKVYEVKVKECSYHTIDEDKKVVEPAVVLEEGDIVSVGDRAFISSRMAHVKIGQVFGLKFEDELPAKVKGYNKTKVIKVFTPKADDGTFLMDQEFLAERSAEENDPQRRTVVTTTDLTNP